jgi:hypothetical protein
VHFEEFAENAKSQLFVLAGARVQNVAILHRDQIISSKTTYKAIHSISRGWMQSDDDFPRKRTSEERDYRVVSGSKEEVGSEYDQEQIFRREDEHRNSETIDTAESEWPEHEGELKEAEWFVCDVDGCTATMQSGVEWENHYQLYHAHVCSACRYRANSERLLHMHISEVHDVFFAERAKREPLYECWVLNCGARLWNAVDRVEHCRQVHGYLL